MIRHIVAIDRQRGIAKAGVQPWRLPMDEQYFSDMTKTFGGVVLMGRTTFEVIGRPLAGRQNFVLTHDESYQADGITVVHDLQAWLGAQQDVWIIGGAKVYEETLGLADELYITRIDADFACDTFYPAYDQTFRLVHAESPLEEGGVSFVYETYKPRHV